MEPNTLHAVFTTKHLIILGGHFYSFTNLQDIILGIIHCFTVDNIVTNTLHLETRVLLFRMMQYFYEFYVGSANAQSEPFIFISEFSLTVCIENMARHLPDLMSTISLIEVLSLCSYCILAKILDYNTYQFPLGKGHKLTSTQLHLCDQYDYNTLDPLKHQYFTHVRGLALNLLTWIACNYIDHCCSRRSDHRCFPL